MVDGRLRVQWDQTAWLAAAAYNAQGPRRAVLPHKLNPYRGLLHRGHEEHDLDDVFGLD